MAKYKDKMQIGSGGFGEVWSTVRDTDGEFFAKKKLLHPDDDECVKRFIKGVRIIASLDHPNIIKVVGKRLRSEPYYYIMPLYKTTLEKQIPLIVGDESRIIPIFSSILDGIEYAHSQGIIHRDLKPGNILMNNDKEIAISDFDLGRLVDSKSTRQTHTGEQLGTLAYMAPELLVNAKSADERADIFSLGRILNELYTGFFISIDEAEEISSSVKYVINKCIDSNRSNRFQTVTDLKQTWLSLFDTSYRESEIDELNSLKIKFSTSELEDISNQNIKRFVDLFAKYQDDPDMLHETIMKIDTNVIFLMYENDSSFMKNILNNFVGFVTDQGWPFDYTDKIANKCKSIFYKIEDYEIRANIIYCTLILGAGHNRWHVLGVFSELIQNPNEAGEEHAVIDKLSSVDQRSIETGKEYLNLNKLHPVIRNFFS